MVQIHSPRLFSLLILPEAGFFAPGPAVGDDEGMQRDVDLLVAQVADELKQQLKGSRRRWRKHF